MARPPLIVIGGPTATGKTGLAIGLARELGRPDRPIEILSADSRQVYRGMNIGTAKPTLAERWRVPHHLLDLVDPDAPFSVADFVHAAEPVLADLARRGGVGLLVGGTGLWLRAIATGLDVDASPADATVRAGLEAELEADGLGVLAGRLSAAAPMTAARTDLRNPRRVVRALEIVRLRGDGPPVAALGYGGRTLRLNLTLDPATNRAWIERRAIAQLDAGLPEEASRLREEFGRSLRSFSAIGYQEAFDLLDGRIDRTGFLAVNVARNVAFARRQRTWFRGAAFGDEQVELDAAVQPFEEARGAVHRFLDG
ncbi:MAG: tRNA (adenosine(37)-N6)-dimethylallyltransferase MiaA, partial [Candidatus Limnocylindrales bacterium]